MIISVDDGNAIHGITIFDEEGVPLKSVQAFNTETFACRLPDDSFVTAGGFVILCNNPKDLRRYVKTLPVILQQFVFYETDVEKQEATSRALIEKQLAHCKLLRASSLAPGD